MKVALSSFECKKERITVSTVHPGTDGVAVLVIQRSYVTAIAIESTPTSFTHSASVHPHSSTTKCGIDLGTVLELIISYKTALPRPPSSNV
ncbi:unnamed protein product [Toxocara canis]|uniref:Uncharacterized protein n=1 Tax=Toxocara canis TaxID=6265 RepID=A0A183V3P9_TOXCA|nr:unnamed protein product [Toxocara canis]